MRRYHKIIIESYNPKGDSLVIGNLPSNDMVRFYGELRTLSESYGMNVSINNKSDILVKPSTLSGRSMIEGIDRFLDDHKYDPTFAKNSETIAYIKPIVEMNELLRANAGTEFEDSEEEMRKIAEEAGNDNENVLAQHHESTRDDALANSVGSGNGIGEKASVEAPKTEKPAAAAAAAAAAASPKHIEEDAPELKGKPVEGDPSAAAEKTDVTDDVKPVQVFRDPETHDFGMAVDKNYEPGINAINHIVNNIAKDATNLSDNETSDGRILTIDGENKDVVQAAADYILDLDAFHGLQVSYLKSMPDEIVEEEPPTESVEAPVEAPVEKEDPKQKASSTSEPVKAPIPGVPTEEPIEKEDPKQKASGTSEPVEAPIPDVPTEEPVEEQKEEPKEDPAVTKLKARYKNVFASIPLVTESDEDAEQLEKMFVKVMTDKKWIDHVNKQTNNGKNIVAIRKKLLPDLADRAGVAVKNVNANGTVNGEESDENIQASGFIVPKRYSKDMKPPILDSKQVVITRFGFPMINCETQTMNILLSDSIDKKDKKPLLKEFINKIKGTDLANAIGKRWGVLDRLMEMKKVQGLFPMEHKNMKVTSVDEIISGSNGGEVSCIPVDDAAKFESVDIYGNALMENIFGKIKDFFAGGKDGTTPSAFGSEIKVSSDYLAQFYELVDFTDEESGEPMYLKYTSNDDIHKMLEAIGESKDGKMPNSKKEIWNAYLRKTKGKPPFYIMQGKSNFKEGIRVSPKPYLRNMYLVKTIVNVGGKKGNRAMYFLTDKQKDAYFTLG